MWVKTREVAGPLRRSATGGQQLNNGEAGSPMSRGVRLGPPRNAKGTSTSRPSGRAGFAPLVSGR